MADKGFRTGDALLDEFDTLPGAHGAVVVHRDADQQRDLVRIDELAGTPAPVARIAVKEALWPFLGQLAHQCGRLSMPAVHPIIYYQD